MKKFAPVIICSLIGLINSGSMGSYNGFVIGLFIHLFVIKLVRYYQNNTQNLSNMEQMIYNLQLNNNNLQQRVYELERKLDECLINKRYVDHSLYGLPSDWSDDTHDSDDDDTDASDNKYFDPSDGVQSEWYN